MKNKILYASLLIISLLSSMIIISACNFSNNEQQEIQYYTIMYKTTTGGKIRGEVLQIIESGDDAIEVTAVANEGYIFIGWSDDVTSPTRKDLNVKSDFTVTALFEPIIYD